MADEHRETLRRLEDRLEEASERAERLIAEAEANRARGPDPTESQGKPPPAGWQTPRDRRQSPSAGAELDALISAARSLRELVPPEVLQRLAEALKEVLLAVRALIDWYIERLEGRRPEPPEVKDIPIE
ncbi:MAG: hypothetical protein ACJ764_09600 [Solirubrobacteraceae bacterium]